MSKLWMALWLSLFGHILAWFHMQGQFKYDWARSIWWVILGGIPISVAYQLVWHFIMEQDGIMNTFKVIGMLDR